MPYVLGTTLCASPIIFHLILPTVLWHQYCYYDYNSHFMMRKTEEVKQIAQCRLPEPGFKPSHLATEAKPIVTMLPSPLHGRSRIYLLNKQEFFLSPSIFKSIDTLHFLPLMKLIYVCESCSWYLSYGCVLLANTLKILEPCHHLRTPWQGYAPFLVYQLAPPGTRVDVFGHEHMQIGFAKHAQLSLSLLLVSFVLPKFQLP